MKGKKQKQNPPFDPKAKKGEDGKRRQRLQQLPKEKYRWQQFSEEE